jgi:drug/metabolite transporter (DMT)-like permease
LNWFLRSPRDGEAVLCCIAAAIGFAGGTLAARRLIDIEQQILAKLSATSAVS